MWWEVGVHNSQLGKNTCLLHCVTLLSYTSWTVPYSDYQIIRLQSLYFLTFLPPCAMAKNPPLACYSITMEWKRFQVLHGVATRKHFSSITVWSTVLWRVSLWLSCIAIACNQNWPATNAFFSVLKGVYHSEGLIGKVVMEILLNHYLIWEDWLFVTSRWHFGSCNFISNYWIFLSFFAWDITQFLKVIM